MIEGIYHRDSFWQDPGLVRQSVASFAPYTWMWNGRQCGQTRTYKDELELRRTDWSPIPPVPVLKPPLWMMQMAAIGLVYSIQSSTCSRPAIQWGWRCVGWSCGPADVAAACWLNVLAYSPQRGWTATTPEMPRTFWA